VIKMSGPWLLIAIPLAVIAKLVQPGEGIEPAPLWARIFIACDAITFYGRKLLWPAELAIIYGRTPAWVMRQSWVYLTPIVPLLLAAGILLYRAGRRWLAAAGIISLACVAPVLGFTPFLFQFHSTVADHYLYLAVFGVALAAAWFLRRSWNRGVAIGCGVVLVALGIRTFAQTLTWENSITLFAHAVEVGPHSATAHNNLGSNLWDAGDHASAAQHFARAVELRGDYPDARKNLAMALTEQGRLDEALEQLQIAVDLQSRLPVRLRPKYESDVINLAKILTARGRNADAIRYLENLLREQPSAQSKKLLMEIRAKATMTHATTTSETTTDPWRPTSAP
jgi:protein O-mannosyl-transferase